jgi:hypothetical protein
VERTVLQKVTWKSLRGWRRKPRPSCGNEGAARVLMTDGPAATVGRIMGVPFERLGSRSAVLKDPEYHACRREVIEFLDVHARQMKSA